jgi:hypothetical protein
MSGVSNEIPRLSARHYRTTACGSCSSIFRTLPDICDSFRICLRVSSALLHLVQLQSLFQLSKQSFADESCIICLQFNRLSVKKLFCRRYTELAALIEPGKTPKTDRNLILEDAIRVVTHVRAENNQLRQLNKFLEEKVQMHEHARGQALYQHTVQMQGGLHPVRQSAANPNNASTSGVFPPSKTANISSSDC